MGIYADGPMCGIVADGELFLKVDATTRSTFKAAGCAPFIHHARGRAIPMSYWSVPEAALDSPEAMRPWALLARDAAARNVRALARKGRTRRRKTPGSG